MKGDEQEDLLSKLANKAKRKLNKQAELDVSSGKIFSAKYEYVQSCKKEEKKKLEKKIVQLLKNNPDCVDPIGKLIDHTVYDNLSDERRQLYILNLSHDYCEICKKLSI